MTLSHKELNPQAHCFSNWKLVDTVTYAGGALYLFDYSLTFGAEIEFIWKAKKKVTLVSVLFLIARYTAFAAVVFSMVLRGSSGAGHLSVGVQICSPPHLTLSLALGFVTIASAELLLAVRTWSVWGRNIKMLAFMGLFALLVVVPSAVVIFRVIVGRSKYVASVGGSNGTSCHDWQSVKENEWIAPLALLMAFELTNIVLLCLRIGTWRRSIPELARSPLLDTLLKDGVGYIVCMFLIGSVNIFLVLYHHAPQLILGGGNLQMYLHSVLSTRAMLNLAATSGDVDSYTATHPEPPFASYGSEREHRMCRHNRSIVA